MSRRVRALLVMVACVALMAALIIQLLGRYDFNGVPFALFGIALAAILFGDVVPAAQAGGEARMSWRRAALLAIIPWVPTMAIILLNIHWHGIAGDSTWSNYLWRVGQIALLLYAGMTWALAMSKPYIRKNG